MKMILESLEGDAGEVARRHGVRVEELERWTVSFLRATAPRRSRLVPALVFTACLGASAALSQAAAFPLSLITFSPNTPAVASQVNANFSALKNGVEYVKTQAESKIGALGTNGVQAKSLSVSGNTNVSGYTVLSGGAAITSGATITGATQVNGATSLNGDTTINGKLTVQGELSSRWIIEAPYNPVHAGQNIATSFKAIETEKLLELCGDYDGCTVRLVAKDWGGGFQDKSMPPVHFEYDGSNFLTSETNLNGNFQSGGGVLVDGAAGVQHALRAWNCHFTDGVFTPGQNASSDPGRGMGLLNWNGDTNLRPTCVLIIDD